MTPADTSGEPPPSSESSSNGPIGNMPRRWLVGAIGACLLLFTAVPLGFLFYGAAGSALGGIVLLMGLIASQAPAVWLIRR